MTQLADLHIHSRFSDSTLSPEEIIEEAQQAGLSCVALTDHDTIDGIAPTQAAGRACGIEVLSAVELSSETDGKDIHLLGYFIDTENSYLKSELEKMRLVRVERMKRMIEKLKGQGITDIDFEDSFGSVQDYSIGRPHLAMVLQEKGHVASLWEAFEKYLGEGRPAYVGKYKMSSVEVIAMIKQAGGLAVLAHPMVTARDELIPGFVAAGLDGIEVYYPNYSQVTISFYENIARKHRLLVTGGSDAHGKAKTNTFIGKIKIPYEIVEKMKERLTKGPS